MKTKRIGQIGIGLSLFVILSGLILHFLGGNGFTFLPPLSSFESFIFVVLITSVIVYAIGRYSTKRDNKE